MALRQKPGTVETYRGVLRNHWLPELGPLSLSAITRERIKTILQRKLMAGMKANTARSMFGVLRTCLNAAVEEERIMGNPAARLGRLIGRSRTEVKIFTPEELARLLQTTAEEMPEVYPLVLTLARTGLRIGEALTLPVRDIELDRREVSVRRT